MALVAVSVIQYGKTADDVKEYQIGDTLSGLTEDQERQLVECGSAIETGDNKKYKSPYYNAFGPVGGTPDADTAKRDALIAGLVPDEERPAGDGSAAAPSLVGVRTSVDIANEKIREVQAQQAKEVAKANQTPAPRAPK